MDTSSTDTSNQKKDPFEQLTREELIIKCKQFLSIAQKAKLSKHELGEENKIINLKLKEIESKSEMDSKAMQEMIGTLTLQKLDLVTKNDSLSKEKQNLNNSYENCQQKLIEITPKVHNLDIENQGYSRQIKRLSEENDQLISHLDALEKRINELNMIGEQQREQLLALEKQNSSKNDKQDYDIKKINVTTTNDTLQDVDDSNKSVDLEKLTLKCNMLEEELNSTKLIVTENEKKFENLYEEIDTLNIKNKQINELKNYCQLKTNEIEMLKPKILELDKIVNDYNLCIENKNRNIDTLQGELDKVNKFLLDMTEKYKTLSEELQNTKKAKEHYNEKFKSYHAKLIKVFTDLKDLKQSKNNLLEVIENYSKYIAKWQIDIKFVSNKFKEEIESRDLELNLVKSENNDLKTNIKNLEDKLSESKLNENNLNLVDLETKVLNLEADLKLKNDSINSLVEENNKMLTTFKSEEVNNLIKQNTDLYNNLKNNEEKVISYSNENNNLLKKIVELEQMCKENGNNVMLRQEIERHVDKISSLLKENELIELNLKSYEEKVFEMQNLLQKVNIEHVEKSNSAELTILTLIEKTNNNEKELQLNKNNLQYIVALEEEKNNLLKELQIITEKINMLSKKVHDLEIIEMNNKELEQINNNLETKNEKIIHSLKETESKNSEYLKTIDNLNDTLKILTENSNINEEELKIIKYNLQSTEQSTIASEKEKNNLLTELQSKLEKINILTKHIDDLEVKEINNKEFEQINKNLEKKYEDLIHSLKGTESKNSEYIKTIDKLNEELKTNYVSKDTFTNLSKNCNDLTEKNCILNINLEKHENELSSYKRDCSDLRNQISISKRENAELLREMNDMNQALKERGETISKQQEYSQELIRKVQNLEQESQGYGQQKIKLEEEITLLKNQTSVKDLTSVLEERNSLLQEKNEIIKSLEHEIKQLKESFNTSFGRDNQDGVYGDSETMSTSTISRTEEASRLRDLEGSWEERYTKLRTLALKLKSKVKESTEQLSQERTEKNDCQTKLTTVTRNLQTIQSEYDKIQDQYEVLCNENKIKQKQIESSTDENEIIKQELNKSKEITSKLEEELNTLRKEKLGSNSAAKQFTNQIQNFKKEIEDSNNKVKDLLSKISTLEINLSSKDQELQNEIKNHNCSKEKLQTIEKDIKKHSVLSLEMEDYERSLKDLSQKLEKKNELISKLEEKSSAEETLITSLNNQLKNLEETICDKETVCLDFEKKLIESQSKISSAEAATAQRENRIREVFKTLEDYKITSEEQISELVETVAKTQKQIEQLISERDHSKSIIFGLEDKIKELTKNCNVFEEELSYLKEDFSNYKVRAQSVLRQNQTRDIGSEERLTDEVTELNSIVELLSAKLENKTIQLKNISEQYDEIDKEKTKVLVKSEELEKKLSKEKEDNQNLLLRQQQFITEHRESMRAQKVHTDTLTQCYKQQLTEQEERHVKELTELKAAHIHANLHVQNKVPEEVDITSMQREEGEGSESIGSNNAVIKSSILSLDKLLNADIETNLDYESELAQCKKEVTEYEAKVLHLTDLLADTEQDLAKHAQLNQHLKEEIRRHQRSVEREEHAENLEYLKNVVFKFLTLNGGDEKSHLVPVLNTILKLSPEETQKLNAVAKGDLRSWGSYLPLWSGSSNQN